MNYYEILEVSPNASQTVIRAAYKSLIQRYHPDKNPGDAAGAARASQVVQAYEVLSDTDKRAAYDRQLKAQSASRPSPAGQRREAPREGGIAAVHARRLAEKEGRYFWFLCLVFLVILIGGGTLVSMLNKRLSAPAAKEATAQKTAPAAPAAEAERREGAPGPAPAPENSGKISMEVVQGPAAGEIPNLVTKLMVPLKRADRPWEDSSKILFIPAIGVKVGPRDAELAIRHLNNTADLIRQKLQESLAEAKIEELIKPEGEQYLAKLILNTISETAGTGKVQDVTPEAPPATERYGVVGVILPEKFTVK